MIDSSFRFYPANRDDAGRGEYWASLALRYCDKLGPVRIKTLLEHFGSARIAVDNVADWKGLSLPAASATCLASGAWREKARLEWDSVREKPCPVLLWTDPEYPALLKNIDDPPVFLYFRGDITLLANVSVAVVGARDCSVEGMRATVNICRGLARAGVTVVSGMARGIDRVAHLAGLEGPGGSVAVLGTGLDVPYPKGNLDLRDLLLEKGLLLTEYAPGMAGKGRHFTIRNRIISGISRAVVVAEAALRSGSLNTARHALEQNRELMSVPGSTGAAYAEGCKELVRRGAKPVFSADDVLRELLPYLAEAVRDGTQARDLARFQRHDADSGRAGEDVFPAELTPGLLPWGIHEDAGAVAPPVSARVARAIREKGPSLPAGKEKCPPPVPGERAGATPAPCGVKEPAPTPVPQTREFPEGLEGQICRAIQGNPQHIDDICRALGQNADSVSRHLLMLELRGEIRRLPGMIYSLTDD